MILGILGLMAIIQVITDTIIMGHTDIVITHITDMAITTITIGDTCLEYALVEDMYLDSHAMVLYVHQTIDDIMVPTAVQPLLGLEVITALVPVALQAPAHVVKATV